MHELVVTGLAPVASGIERPEDVLSLPDGRVFASDSGGAVAQLAADGSFTQVGSAGGAPNGIAYLPNGDFVIANFEEHSLQRIELATGRTYTWADALPNGKPLQYANYPLADMHGGVWLSCCTAREDISSAVANPDADGMVVYVSPAGDVKLVAHEVFPNCMAFDAAGEYLYVARTTPADVVRFPILGPGELGPAEPYGPALGGRTAEEVGDAYLESTSDPDTARRWGMADGIAFDGEGNLWVTLIMSGQIFAIAPDQTAAPVTFADSADLVVTPTSVCWSGPDMQDVYIGSMAASYVLKGRSSVPGIYRYPAPV